MSEGYFRLTLSVFWLVFFVLFGQVWMHKGKPKRLKLLAEQMLCHVWAWKERCYSKSKLGGRTKPFLKTLLEKPQDPSCFSRTEDKAVRGQSMVVGSCVSVKDT